MKLYVLVRDDLPSWQQKAVQAGHAVAQFLQCHRDTKWENGILVYLKVRDEDHLMEYYDLFDDGPHHIRFQWFDEEDLNGEMTAIAATGVDELVKDLPLL
jgi:hypothetical protein